MNFILPALSAALQGASVTLDKAILLKRRMDERSYITRGFPLYFLFTLAVFLVLRPPIHIQDLKGMMGLFMILTIVITSGTNVLFYRAMKGDVLSEIQTVELLKDLPTILLVSLLFTDERRPIVLAAAVIATLTVVWSHWKHHHFSVKGATAVFLAWMLVTKPLQAVMAKELLVVWHPVSLEFIRTAGLTLILVPLFWKGAKRVPRNVYGPLILTNALSALGWVLYYMSFKASGVIYTVLLFSLQPFLVYTASMMFLKEKFHWKKCVGFIVVLICVAIAQLS